MEPVGNQQLPVTAAAAANGAPAAAIAGANAGAQEGDEPDWQNLLPELVGKVADIVLRSSVRDYIRLRAVCKAWRSAP